MDEGKIPEKKLKLGLIYDTTEWEPHVKGFKAAMEEFKDSFEVVAEVPYELGASSFNAIIDKLRAAKPDALLGFSTYSDIAGILKYMKMGKFRPKFVYLFDANLPEFITGFKEMAEGISSYWDWPMITSDITPLYSKFREYFLAQGWGEPSIVYQVGLLAGVEVLVKAIETVGLDSEKIKNYLNTAEFSTCVGTIKFGDMDVLGTKLHGVNLMAIGNVFQVQNGKYVQIWPAKYATGNLQYPLSPDF
jgi:ABC-type branched-subunit amino acid transport system substrate-binding protein